jgi:CTP synthase
MRLGAYDCDLKKDSIAYHLYGQKIIRERHRHRLEVNEVYVHEFESKGFIVSGRNPQTNLVEIMELNDELHPYFVGTQAHPEFKSRLTTAAPLFVGLIAAALKNKKPSFENINKS